MTDIVGTSTPSFLMVSGRTAKGRKWLRINVGGFQYLGSYAVEHRYGPDILLGAHNAGLTVECDGRLVDVERQPITPQEQPS